MDDPEELCDFEKECLATIEKNRKALRALGFSTPPRIQLATSHKRPNVKTKAHARGATEPSARRRSKRLRGESAQVALSECKKPSTNKEPRSQMMCERVEADMYNYSMMRLHTMSEKALATRIKKLQRVDKLEAFIEVCKDNDRIDLMRLAQQRLSDM